MVPGSGHRMVTHQFNTLVKRARTERDTAMEIIVGVLDGSIEDELQVSSVC